MKVFISVDMEGISGIVDTTMTSRTQPDYEKGRALMAKDVNACIEGILTAGPAHRIHPEEPLLHLLRGGGRFWLIIGIDSV